MNAMDATMAGGVAEQVLEHPGATEEQALAALRRDGPLNDGASARPEFDLGSPREVVPALARVVDPRGGTGDPEPGGDDGDQEQDQGQALRPTELRGKAGEAFGRIQRKLLGLRRLVDRYCRLRPLSVGDKRARDVFDALDDLGPIVAEAEGLWRVLKDRVCPGPDTVLARAKAKKRRAARRVAAPAHVFRVSAIDAIDPVDAEPRSE